MTDPTDKRATPEVQERAKAAAAECLTPQAHDSFLGGFTRVIVRHFADLEPSAKPGDGVAYAHATALQCILRDHDLPSDVAQCVGEASDFLASVSDEERRRARAWDAVEDWVLAEAFELTFSHGDCEFSLEFDDWKGTDTDLLRLVEAALEARDQ